MPTSQNDYFYTEPCYTELQVLICFVVVAGEGGSYFVFSFEMNICQRKWGECVSFSWSLPPFRETWPPLRCAPVIVLETQKPVYSKNRKLSYQIPRGWFFLLSSRCTGIGLLLSCGPPSLLRSCVVPFQAVLDSFCTGPSSKSPDDLGDVDKYQASLLHPD